MLLHKFLLTFLDHDFNADFNCNPIAKTSHGYNHSFVAHIIDQLKKFKLAVFPHFVLKTWNLCLNDSNKHIDRHITGLRNSCNHFGNQT